ncbi:MAG: glycerol-3-phosphate O-acyltransferase/dihydroxyacetone phosphate acyltransferase [Maribacter sp.]|jgi:glycerol-3-phosphate O-acyltransferase/dihydroxyacetone phosphate acyltransferase
MTWLQKIIYIYLNNLARLVFAVYFKRITIQGKELIPKDCPTIIAPNHPNTLIDPVLMANMAPGWIHFLANYGLFKHPVSKFLMSKCFFSIPVKRPKDVAPGEKVNNLATIKQCSKVLEDGGTIFMGPEATSYTYKRVRPLKDGISRIALTSAKFQKFKSGLIILPFGTNYSDPTLFRSEIIIRVGDPIFMDDFKDDYKKNKPATADKVMQILRDRLESLSIHTQDEVDSQFLTWIETIARSEKKFDSFEGQLKFDQEKLPITHNLRNKNYDAFESIWQDCYHYFKTIEEIDTQDKFIKTPVKNLGFKTTIQDLLYPIYIIANIINSQWYIPSFVLKKLKLYRGYSSMIKLLGGAIIVPLVTSIIFFIIAIILNYQYAIAYLVLSSILGLSILPYKNFKSRIKQETNIKQYTKKEKLYSERNTLVRKLKELDLL